MLTAQQVGSSLSFALSPPLLRIDDCRSSLSMQTSLSPQPAVQASAPRLRASTGKEDGRSRSPPLPVYRARSPVATTQLQQPAHSSLPVSVPSLDLETQGKSSIIDIDGD